jgi:hypothetical protein
VSDPLALLMRMNGRQLRLVMLVAIVFVVFLSFQSFQLSYATHSTDDVNHLHHNKINNNKNLTHDNSRSKDLKKDSAGDTSSWMGATHLGGREYNLQCWLDPAWGRPSLSPSLSSSLKNGDNSNVTCVGKHPVVANTNATSLTCGEKNDSNNNTSHAPIVVPSPPQRRVLQNGITIALLYYARPSMLLHHLETLASYPLELQQQLTLLIIDDGSPIGLRATDYMDRSHFQTTLSVRIRITRVTRDIAWNIGGARNLAFYLVDTSKVLLLDLDMMVPVETMTEVLTSPSWSTMNGTLELAHRFNRKRLNGKAQKHPAVSVLDVASYWKSGGCDEDFVGQYGYTDVHFWHRWRLDPIRRVVEHPTTFIHEIHHEDYCSVEWLAKGMNIQDKEKDTTTTTTTTTTLHQLEQTCRTALAALKVPGKWGQQFNKIKIRQKMETGCWSNLFLRFPWKVEW